MAAKYCDRCGVEIWEGTHCKGCDPSAGSEEVVIRFAIWKEDTE
ncbi:hypothetical protein P4K82_27855 [Bacillus cereus]|nr:hypothetical protein [Bacillus cereus]